MARSDRGRNPRPSVLDRLIDQDPSVNVEADWTRSIAVGDLKKHVQRDLEVLLNTRHAHRELAESDSELSCSVLTFGVPDFSASGITSDQEREALRRHVERSIRRFEGRLDRVRVSLQPRKGEHDLTVRMTIEAMLAMDPFYEPVSFDTVVHTSKGECRVEAG